MFAICLLIFHPTRYGYCCVSIRFIGQTEFGPSYAHRVLTAGRSGRPPTRYDYCCDTAIKNVRLLCYALCKLLTVDSHAYVVSDSAQVRTRAGGLVLWVPNGGPPWEKTGEWPVGATIIVCTDMPRDKEREREGPQRSSEGGEEQKQNI